MFLLACRRIRMLAIVLASTGLITTFGYSVDPIDEIFEPEAPKDANAYGMVAVVAWASDVPTPLEVNLDEAETFKQTLRDMLAYYVRKAAAHGAKMVITPEFATVGYPDQLDLPPEADQFQSRADIAPYVEPIPGKTTDYFSKLAQELGIYIHFGMAEVDIITGNYYNTVVAVDPQGKIVATYRKMHLFTVENEFLVPGTSISTYNSPFGKVGISICSDIYSWEVLDSYREAEIQVNALSTSWAAWNTGMSNFRRGARSMNAYVLASNQTYFPDSGVINPDGSNQSWIRQSTGIAYGYLPYVKAILPVPPKAEPTPTETPTPTPSPTTAPTPTPTPSEGEKGKAQPMNLLRHPLDAFREFLLRNAKH